MTPLGSLVHDTNSIIGHLRNRALFLERRPELAEKLTEQVPFLQNMADKLQKVIDAYYLMEKEKGTKLF